MKCAGCGNPIEEDFNFCPRCGRSVEGIKSFEALLDTSFSRLSLAEAVSSAEKLAELDESLRVLENELDEFASSDQRLRAHRR